MPAPIPPRFSSTLRRDDLTAVVVVEGELDLSSADQFDGTAEEALATGLPIVVDLTACSFMDSTGLQRVLRHREAASRAEQGFVLALQPGGPVDRVVGLVAPGLFETADTADAARGRLRAPSL